jgi:hypothetical protein
MLFLSMILIPTNHQDDNAKERQRANEEMHNARLAFDQYGSERFVQTFWRFVAMDVSSRVFHASICLLMV